MHGVTFNSPQKFTQKKHHIGNQNSEIYRAYRHKKTLYQFSLVLMIPLLLGCRGNRTDKVQTGCRGNRTDEVQTLQRTYQKDKVSTYLR